MQPNIFLVVSALAIGACSSDYVYEPAVNATARVNGVPAADYQIPPELPQGDVRLSTFGIAKLRSTDNREAGRIRALHVRMVVANNARQPWTIDTREQRAVLVGGNQSRPAFAAAESGVLPTVEIPPGSRRTIDLYFPLPQNLQSAKKIPSFDVVWTVHTAERVVTERTPFERLEVVPYADYGYDPYWYDPFYPAGSFYGAGALPPVYVERPVIIERPRPPPAVRVR
jgi:hypothetical protein